MTMHSSPSSSRSAGEMFPQDLDVHAPVVLTGRGGSGTRLFSTALQEIGVFLGNDINPSGDSKEWVDVVYATAIDKLNAPDATPPGTAVAALRSTAAAILGESERNTGCWGWKLPETTLILPEVAAAFERARFLYVVRHPLDTCLRRSHMTSRSSNPMGNAVLKAAYARLGWGQEPDDEEPEHLRNAASWLYQVEQARNFLVTLPAGRGLVLRYESMCEQPHEVVARMAAFIGIESRSVNVQISEERRRQWDAGDPRIKDVWDICGQTAQTYGYGVDGSVVLAGDGVSA